MQTYPDTHPSDFDHASARLLRTLGSTLMDEAKELNEIADREKAKSLAAAETYLETGLLLAHLSTACTKAGDRLAQSR